MYVLIYILCIYVCICVFIYYFIYLFIYLFLSSLPSWTSWPNREKRAWILEDVHLIISAFPASVEKFISARFPTLQTITGTRLHILSLTDVLCTHVGTLQVICL